MKATLLLTCLVRILNAIYVSVDDSKDAYPLVRRVEDASTVRWSVGDMARARLSSNAVRVSNRGIRFIAATMRLHSLEGWKQEECTAKTGFLCVTAEGTPLFAEVATDVKTPPTRDMITDPIARYITEEECTQFSQRIVTDTTNYTVSLCDITQKGYEFVLADGTLYTKDRDEGFLFYLVMSIGTIVLITSVAQNIANLLGETTVITSIWVEFAVAITLLIMSCVQIHLITVSDLIFFYYTIGYVVVNIVYWVCKYIYIKESKGVPINVLIATVLMAICRLYNGIECEYVSPLLFILLTRSFYKAQIIFQTPLHTYDINAHHHAHHKLANDETTNENSENFVPLMAAWNTPASNALYFTSQITVIMDFILVAITYQFGFRPLFTQTHHADAFFVFFALFAYFLTLFLRAKAVKTAREE